MINYENRDPETTTVSKDHEEIDINPIVVFRNMLENNLEDEDLEYVLTRLDEIISKLDEVC
jgi:hypothetical protein